jgi:hypothetical protein
MSSNPFQPATREQCRARFVFTGPTGSGKTFTALSVAQALGDRVAVIDSEPGTAAKYADRFRFDWASPADHDPRKWMALMVEAERAGYDVLILDSFSAPWAGKGGILEMVDRLAPKYGGNKWAAWNEGTAMYNALVEQIQRSRCHVIATLRVKTAWVVEKDARNGKDRPVEVGMEAVQRDGLEYEFDFVFRLDQNNNCWATKWRDPAFQDYLEQRPGAALGERLRTWLENGSTPAVVAPAAGATTGPVPPLPPPAAAPAAAGVGRQASGTVPPADGPVVRVESNKLTVQERRTLWDLLRTAGISLVDGGPGKPVLAKLPADVALAMRLEPNGPPLDLRKLERGAYQVLVPLLQQMVANGGPAPAPANGGANGQAAASAAAEQQELLGG